LGAIAFQCKCGDILDRVPLIRAHALIHAKVLHDDTDPDDFVAPDQVPRSPHYGEGDEYSDEEEEKESEEGNVWYLYEEAGEDTSSDTDDDHAGLLSMSVDTSCPTAPQSLNMTMDYSVDLSVRKQRVLQLYRYVIDSRLTTSAYKALLKLPIISNNGDVPKNLKDLRHQVESILAEDYGWPLQRVHCSVANGISYRTPYLSITDCLHIWFATPPILSALRSWQVTYLPRYLNDPKAFDDILLRRMLSPNHSYETVGDGNWYIENVRDAIPLFESQYLAAIDDGIEVIICQVGLYEDGFCKNLSSLVSEMIYCATLGTE